MFYSVGFWCLITFNKISVISWQLVLLVEETGVSVENHRQTFPHNVVSNTPCLSGIQTHNYHMITTRMASIFYSNTYMFYRRRDKGKEGSQHKFI